MKGVTKRMFSLIACIAGAYLLIRGLFVVLYEVCGLLIHANEKNPVLPPDNLKFLLYLILFQNPPSMRYAFVVSCSFLLVRVCTARALS